jgi:hypothetical protein
MLNDKFVAEQAKHFADRVAKAAGNSREKVIGTAFRMALVRRPSATEMEICSRLLERQAEVFRKAKLPARQAEHQALVQLCHTLFNTSEFLYAE